MLLSFIKSHDWGAHAYIHDGKVYGLINNYFKDGADYYEVVQPIPATMASVREFGGY